MGCSEDDWCVGCSMQVTDVYCVFVVSVAVCVNSIIIEPYLSRTH